MNVFETVKANVSARDAAEHYGIKVSRSGMACCPFHPDKHPSMKLDQRFHCFGCGEDGDVIDFAAKYLGVDKYHAAVSLAEAFGLPFEEQKAEFGLRSKVAKNACQGNVSDRKTHLKKLEHKLRSWIQFAWDVLVRYLKWLEFWKEFYAPENRDEEWHPLFAEALQNREWVNYYLDILQMGSDAEQIDFFRVERKEVGRIDQRVRDYERAVLAELRGEPERRSPLCG